MSDGITRRPLSKVECAQQAEIVKAFVSAAFDVTLEALNAPTRSKAPIAFARQIAMYLSHTVCGMSLAQVAGAFRRDRTTVSHACHLIEDRRDDAYYDAEISRLETEVRGALACLTRKTLEHKCETGAHAPVAETNVIPLRKASL